jgi:WD40 repeat protein
MAAIFLVCCCGLIRSNFGAENAPAKREPLPGLIPSPRSLPGAGRWQLAHKIPRGRIYSIAWSPDGKKIAYSETTYVRICDAQTFDTERILAGHANRVTSIDWSRATNRIASASFDGTVRIWSAEGVPENVLKGHTGQVNSVAWTKDGARLASAGSDGTVRIWNAEGSAGRTLNVSAPVGCVAWSPDGSRLASGGEDHKVKIWNADGRLLHVCEGHLERVTSVAWSPDGKWLGSATAGYESDGPNASQVADVRLWTPEGSPNGSITNDVSNFGLQWTPDSRSLVVSSERGGLRFLAPNAEVKSSLHAPNVEVQMSLVPLAISPDGNELAVGGTGGITVIAAEDASKNRSSPRSPVVNRRYLDVLAAAPNRTRLILRIPDVEPRIMLFNLMTGSTVDVPNDVVRSQPTDASFNPNGDRVIFAAGETQLSIWNPEDDSIKTVTRSTQPIAASAWSPLGDRIAYCDDHGAIHVVKTDGTPVVDLSASQSPAAAPTPGQAVRLQFSPDAKAVFVERGTRVDVRRLDGTAAAAFDFGSPFERFWIAPDLRQAAATHEIEMESHTVSFWPAGATAAKNVTDLGTGIDSLDCSPDVTRLVVGYTNGNWIMRRLDDPAAPQLETLAHYNTTLMATMFSPDGQRFATGGWDAVVKIWKLEGTLEGALMDNTHPLFKLWWSRDGKRLLSTARDGTICLWSTSDDRLESLTILTVPGVLLHVPNDGLVPAKDAEAASRELLTLVEKPNGSMELVDYLEFLKRTGQSAR